MSTFFFVLATKKTPGKISGRTCWRLIPTCEFFLVYVFIQTTIGSKLRAYLCLISYPDQLYHLPGFGLVARVAATRTFAVNTSDSVK